MKIFGIEFAPLWIPFDRRLQTASLIILYVFPFVFAILNVVVLWYDSVRPFYFAYLVWMCIDNVILRTPFRTGRPVSWLRDHAIWRKSLDYFPMEVHCEKPFVGGKPYIFGFHPHGIVGMGVIGNFVGNAARTFAKTGVDVRVVTVRLNFWIPFWRDYLMGIGFIDAGKSTFKHVLKNNGAIGVVVGGAAEATHSQPGQTNLVLNKRVGFIKQALLHGASLVPVFLFGESDLYDQIKGGNIGKFQDWMKKKFGFVPALFHGRGIFNYNFGLLPHRRKVSIVVGDCMEVPHTPNPSEELVSVYHKKYIDALKKLHDDNKERFPFYNGNISVMNIVD